MNKPFSYLRATCSIIFFCLLTANPSTASELPKDDSDTAVNENVQMTQTTQVLETQGESLPPAMPISEISAETVAKVEELLSITDTEALNLQVMESMVDQFRQVITDVPDDWWDRFLDKIDYAELNRLVIPIYAQHFTIEELDAIIAFYKTPAGQTVLEKMPSVLQDSMLVGQQWGMEIARQVLDDLEAEGYAVPDEPFIL
ncbi:MAG: DUF2059 domain-containing protein [Cyanobacteria bacterium P01_D01_bin.1]